MDETIEILVDILADTDAIWRPHRGPWVASHAATVIAEHRRDFPEWGIPWASDAATEAGRKATQRDLEILVDDGLVTAFRSAGRSVGVALTDKGDQFARAYASLCSVEDGFLSLRRIIALEPESRCYIDQFAGLVPETRLAGVDYGGDTLSFSSVQNMMLPALVRGWVEARSSIYGHVWYGATDRGREAANQEAYGDSLPALPQPDDEAAAHYWQRHRSTLARLHERDPRSMNDIGMIPLPVSFARLDCPKGFHVHGLTEASGHDANARA